MSDVDTLTAKLAELRGERDTLVATRTKEDVQALAESWLAAALGQVNGATNYVLNGHIGPAEVRAVLSEYLLESGALGNFIIAKVEAAATLTNRQKDAKEKKLNAAIAKAEQEALEEARAAALAEVEARFSVSGEAA
jgi:flagellar biosynthesis/type III secretory pathway protein FliH